MLYLDHPSTLMCLILVIWVILPSPDRLKLQSADNPEGPIAKVWSYVGRFGRTPCHHYPEVVKRLEARENGLFKTRSFLFAPTEEFLVRKGWQSSVTHSYLSHSCQSSRDLLAVYSCGLNLLSNGHEGTRNPNRVFEMMLSLTNKHLGPRDLRRHGHNLVHGRGNTSRGRARRT